MSLNDFVAKRKRAIYDELMAGQAPTIGEYDEGVYREAIAKGSPQMGSTSYAPDLIYLEYIYSNQQGATILSVILRPPERIVFLPVPEWVIESIWQGEVTGSYHFESDAMLMVEELKNVLASHQNATLFGAKQVIGKA